jgi:hypothetical protein
MKTCGSGGVSPPFLTSTLHEGEWSALRSGRVIIGERVSGTHRIGGGVGPQSRSRRYGEEREREILPLLVIDSQASRPQPVTVPTELSGIS